MGVMGNILSGLIVPVALDPSKFTDGLDRLKGETNNSFTEIGGKLTNIGTKMTVGLSAPILGGMTGAVAATNDWADTVDSLGDVLGTSADDSAALAYAIGNVGGDVEGITTQMARLAMDLVDSNGELGRTGEILNTMGIAFQDANGNMLPSVDIIENIATKLSAMPDGLEKSALLADLFGRSAIGMTDTLNALANGGLEQAKVKAGELGLMLGDNAVENSIEFGKSMADLKMGTQGLAVSFGTTLIPLLVQLIDKIVLGLKWFNSLDPSIKNVILIVAGLVAAIGPLLVVIGSISTGIGALIPVVTAVAGVISFPLIAIIGAVIGVIALLGVAWANNWGGIQEKVQTVIDWISPYIEKAFEFWRTIFGAFSLAFQGDWSGFGEKLREAWDMLWEHIKGIFTGAWDWFTGLDWGEIGKNVVEGIANGITNAVTWLTDSITGVGESAVSALKGFLGISSPSKKMKLEVGYEMANGVTEGWEEKIKYFKPGFGSMGASFNPSHITSDQSRFVQFVYSPTFSLADQYEAENILRPIVEEVVRSA